MSNLLNYRLFFFVPFLYFFKTRLKNKSNKISWILIYIVPILLMVFFQGKVSFLSVLSIFIYITSIYTVYEMGYIWNDTETIKNEKEPTKRLSDIELKFYEKNKYLIYITRLTFVFLFSFYFISSNIYVFFITNMLAILILYLIYNSNRNILNLPLHFLLVCARFVAPVIAFTSVSFLWVAFVFPIINLLERASEKRFRLHFFYNFFLSDKKRGRYIYYIILFFICLYFNSPTSITVTVIYMFFYRFFSYELTSLWSEK